MTHLDVQEILRRAREAMGLKSDKDLAQHLGVPRETVASWKRRHSIPAKHLSSLTAGGLSLDWLLTGRGERQTTDEFGFSRDQEDNLDDDALWLALLLSLMELRDLPLESDRKIWESVGKKELMQLHIWLQKNYPTILQSKERWLGSKIIAEKDALKALMVEYDLLDNPISEIPWWEDEELT